jgi:hypothetical protein
MIWKEAIEAKLIYYPEVIPEELSRRVKASAMKLLSPQKLEPSASEYESEALPL